MLPGPIEKLEQSILGALGLSPELLDELSGLDGALLNRFTELWRTLNTEQRATLVNDLGEAAEEDLVLEFTSIYRLALTDLDPTVRELGVRLAAEEARPDLLDAYLLMAEHDPDHAVRAAALEQLAAFTLAAQVEDWSTEAQQKMERVLSQALSSPESDLSSRRAALLSLAYLTTPVTERLIRDAYQEIDLQDVALEAMGHNCQEIWTPLIVEALASDEPRLRLSAARAAGEMQNTALITNLIARVQDSDQRVSLAAIDALGAIGGETAKEILSDLLSFKDATIRTAARDALEQLVADEDDAFAGALG